MGIVITEFISLDGVVQAPGGPDEDRDGGFAHGGWSHPFFDPEVMGAAWTTRSNADALLYGRRTWQGMAAAWPGRAGDPFADRMNAIPKYVVSSPSATTTWSGTTHPHPRRRGRAAHQRAARAHRRQPGGHGQPTLVRTLLSEGLVDELRLMIEPVLLGGGKSIFPEDGGMRTLELVSTVTAATGTNVCVYRVRSGE